jgi:uncharacterized repeat protein (TIGR02543 family)
VTITANQTLYAQWIARTFAVTFNANGGSVTPTSMSVTYGSTYGTLPTPTKAGYTFNGWFTSASGGSQVSSGTTVAITEDQTLHAVWHSLLSEYSIAADCTNLVLECRNPGAMWSIDYGSGYASTSSVYAVGKAAAELSVAIEGAGTLSFRLKCKSSDTIDKVFKFIDGRINDDIKDDDVVNVYKSEKANGEWLHCMFNKREVENITYKWAYFNGKSEDDYIYIDQVHWYPDKQVIVDKDANDNNNWKISNPEINNIKESVLLNWDDIFLEDANEVSAVRIKVGKSDTDSSVTNGLALLNLGYAPKYSVNGKEATLTFTNAPSLNIAAFAASLLPTTGLEVSVTNTAWGLPDWSDGVEYMLGVWGASSLTSTWSKVDSSCDLSRYLTEGVAVFDFDVGTNRFFKVRAE